MSIELDYQSLNKEFENRPPAALLRWAAATFGHNLALATSFGPQSIVLLHMLTRQTQQVTAFYLDTNLLFPETYTLRDKLAAQFGIEFVRVQTKLSLDQQAEQYGQDLWQINPDQCCQLRKVLPMKDYLADKQAWITGVRRQHASTRASAQLIEWDKTNQLVKLNPLARWTRLQVWAYIHEYELPTNELHNFGFTSIGCWPCTRAVLPGEEERAGRWAGRGKTECGIHFNIPAMAQVPLAA